MGVQAGPVGHLRARSGHQPPTSSAETTENDLRRTSTLRHPGQAQTLVYSVAPGKEGRIVARCSGAQAADGEGRIKDKGRSRSGLCLIQLAKPHQRAGEPNLRKG